MKRNPDFDILFEPVQIGPVITRNRFYQVPHADGMGYMMPHARAAMREVKAEGGWGVVCTEYCSIHPSSDDSPLPYATLWDDKDIKAHSLMVEKVHDQGALAGVELWHGGMSVSNLMSREAPVDVISNPVLLSYDPVQSRAMDKKDIRSLRRWQVNAAKMAVKAGFDIIYVYASHNYLLSHFVSPEWNQRTDEYGGSLKNRVRIIRELIQDTKEAVGDRCAIAVRIATDGSGSRDGFIDNGEQREMIAMIADLPDLWDVNVFDYSLDIGSSRFVKEAAQEEYISFVKKLSEKPIVGVGRFTSPDTMVRQIRKGVLDLIGAARPSIADPFLPQKIEDGRYEDIRECIGCNICHASDTQCIPIRCTQNPTMGEEWRRGYHPEKIPPKDSDNRILIVGSGPAGLEAARALGQRGYDVTLAEAGVEPGGRVLKECSLPGLSEWRRVIEYRVQQIKRMQNVELFFDSRLTADDIRDYGYDRVITATGSTWRKDGVGRWHSCPVKGFDRDSVFTPDDIMAGVMPQGPVVIYDDDHYYMGSVLAEKLRNAGLEVTFVTPAGLVAEWTIKTIEQSRIQARLLNLGVNIITAKVVSGFDGETAEISCIFTDNKIQLQASSVVTVTSRLPNDDLYKNLMSDEELLETKGIKSVVRTGDCLCPGIIAAAVHSGHRAAREIDSTDHEETIFQREIMTVNC